MPFTIRVATIEAAAALLAQLPEFTDPPTAADCYERIGSRPYCCLVAEADGRVVGCKLGYDRDGEFYSWLGGVLPAYRRRGIARGLALAQEAWARRRGYTAIAFKTRNQHKAMLAFALQNGFDVVGFTEKATVATNRILLRKVL